MTTYILCFSCKKKIHILSPIQRRDECEQCGADLRACLNCKFYDKSSYNECRENSADRVKEKDRANFCDYFTPSNQEGEAKPESSTLRDAAEALFTKKTKEQ